MLTGLNTPLTDECNNELGMQSKRIPDENITSSSMLSSNHAPSFARLNGRRAWCSAAEDESPYIQILLDEEKLITTITTQGSSRDFSWARKYFVRYLEGGNWISYQQVIFYQQACSTVAFSALQKQCTVFLCKQMAPKNQENRPLLTFYRIIKL